MSRADAEDLLAEGESLPKRRRDGTSAAFGALAHLSLAALAVLVLVAAAQPLQTDDLWWHLALGKSYASEGPWLAEDPLLHTAVAPPAPAAWLSDLLLHATGSLGGFHALRALHALAVAAIVALTWVALRRASRSPALASCATGVLVALSGYRLYQLRPELVSILATLVLYRLLLAPREPPSWPRVALSAALLALWANAHAGFLLGPILVAAAIAGLVAFAAIGAPSERRSTLARARRLAAALGLGLVATLANPAGLDAHRAYLRAGEDSPDLAAVTDEWARIELFDLPVANLPPTPLAWGLVWLLLVSTLASIARAALVHRRRGGEPSPDPALAGLALASLAAMLLAVRFLWLGFFPLLLLAHAVAGRRTRLAAIATGLAAAMLVPGFLRIGDWPMLSRTLPRNVAEYAEPWLARKYHAFATAFLADAGLEGRLYNDYFLGGSLGYWLAPRLRAFVNGSLNLPREALADHTALLRRRGSRPGEGFLELLDRHEVDLFVGVRLPQVPKPNRTWIYTSGHLDGAPGWIPIWRDWLTSVHLRANPRNRANLERVADYYAGEGVPFDPQRGFDPAAAIRAAPRWAIAHGLAPRDLPATQADARSDDPVRKRAAMGRLAALYVALGAYEEALALDRELVAANPEAIAPTRRLVWSLLRLGRGDEADAAADTLRRMRSGPISRALAAAAREAVHPDAPDAPALLVRVPLFTRAEASRLGARMERPPVRAWRE